MSRRRLRASAGVLATGLVAIGLQWATLSPASAAASNTIRSTQFLTGTTAQITFFPTGETVNALVGRLNVLSYTTQDFINGQEYQISGTGTDGLPFTSGRLGPVNDLQVPSLSSCQPDATGGTLTFDSSPEYGRVTAILSDSNSNVVLRQSFPGSVATPFVGGSLDTSGLSPDGSKYSLVVKDAVDQVSEALSCAMPDLLAPEVRDVAIENRGNTATGKTEAGALVVVKLADGTTIGTGVAAADGTFAVQFVRPYANGEVIAVVAQDAAKNVSAPVETSAPDLTAPTIEGRVTPDGTSATGTTEPGATVQVLNESRNEVGTTVADGQGNWSTQLNPAFKNGEVLYAEAIDAAGNRSASYEMWAPDITPPWVIGRIDGVGETAHGTAEAFATIVVKDAQGAVLGTGATDAAGNWTVVLSRPQKNGERSTVVAVDRAGNHSLPFDMDAPDLVAPAVQGQIDQSTGATASGTTEPGANITVFAPDGSPLAVTRADGQGNWSVALDPAYRNREELTVVAGDQAGNESDPYPMRAPDLTPPTVEAAVDQTDGATVSGTTEPGATVTVTLDGTKLGTTTADDQGRWSLPLSPALTKGEVLDVVAADAAGNRSAAVHPVAPVLAPPTTAPPTTAPPTTAPPTTAPPTTAPPTTAPPTSTQTPEPTEGGVDSSTAGPSDTRSATPVPSASAEPQGERGALPDTGSSALLPVAGLVGLAALVAGAFLLRPRRARRH